MSKPKTIAPRDAETKMAKPLRAPRDSALLVENAWFRQQRMYTTKTRTHIKPAKAVSEPPLVSGSRLIGSNAPPKPARTPTVLSTLHTLLTSGIKAHTVDASVQLKTS